LQIELDGIQEQSKPEPESVSNRITKVEADLLIGRLKLKNDMSSVYLAKSTTPSRIIGAWPYIGHHWIGSNQPIPDENDLSALTLFLWNCYYYVSDELQAVTGMNKDIMEAYLPMLKQTWSILPNGGLGIRIEKYIKLKSLQALGVMEM